jgi:diguanylate cyclase (GGDEF)-like protein
MPGPAPSPVAGYLAAAACALLIASILTRFHRVYGREYLRYWAASWMAFSFSLLGGGAASYLQTPSSSGRTLIFLLTAIAGFWQIAWLLFGTYGVISGGSVPRRLVRGTLAGLVVLAAILGLVSAVLGGKAGLLIRFGPPYLCAGLAFGAAGVGVLRTGRGTPGFGRRLVAASFLLYGLEQLAYSANLLYELLFAQSSSHMMVLLLPLDFLLQTAMGLGMVIWLLDEEWEKLSAATRQISHLAYHDTLTDLPNRNLFLKTLGGAVESARRDRQTVSVFVLDLDRFKVINDSLGYGQGDALVRMVANRLSESLPAGGLLARLGGDEFALLLVGDRAAATLQADAMLAAVRRPFLLDDQPIFVTASVGISHFPGDGVAPEDLLKRADLAMYRAKAKGRDAPQRTGSMELSAVKQLTTEHDLRRALEASNELALFYQPLVGTRSRQVEAVEALIRWHHPTRGLLLPEEFLSIADLCGLSNPLDLWVLRAGCREIQAWRTGGLPNLHLAINLSARAFQHPDLVGRLKSVLEETGLSAEGLEIEITETLAMENAAATLEVLRVIKELGVRISIDDFGTGYSSLSYLSHFPIDTLKIDASFVRDLPGDRGSAEIAAAVIALAHSLGIRVVAEGVEREDQWRVLEEKGCDEIQGYFLARPLPAAECRDAILGGRFVAPARIAP